MERRAVAVVAALWLFWATGAWAETPVSRGRRPPSPSAAGPVRPVPASAVRQAEAQNNGEFPAMRRSAIGDQVQEAWDDAAAFLFAVAALQTFASAALDVFAAFRDRPQRPSYETVKGNKR